MGDTSATGVAFTRDPATGERLLRRMAGQRQGEDVVAGIRTAAVSDEVFAGTRRGQAAVDGRGDACGYGELAAVFELLEAHTARCRTSSYRGRGKLWMLQTPTGKRTAKPRSRWRHMSAKA